MKNIQIQTQITIKLLYTHQNGLHGFEAGVNVIFTRGIGLVLNHMLTYFKKGNLTLVSLKDIFGFLKHWR